MDRLSKLSQAVEKLYACPKPDADPWINWGYKNHVLVVVKNAEEMAAAKSANVKLCVAGALLHDIADTEMLRKSDNHEIRSLKIARELLKQHGFDAGEVEQVATGIIAPHSCIESLPETLEGKILATADALAHFETDFYIYFCWQHWSGDGEQGYADFKKWALSKIERDFARKIFFEDIKERARPSYRALKSVFAR